MKDNTSLTWTRLWSELKIDREPKEILKILKKVR